MGLNSNQQADLKELGWCRFSLSETGSSVEELCASLGFIIYITEVKPKHNAKGLVTSLKPLAFHTDHSRADFVAWYCHSQSETGGETILTDAVCAFDKLTDSDKSALKKVLLYEHKIFPDDPEQTPFVDLSKGIPEIYFSYWFAEDIVDPATKNALQSFKSYLEASPKVRFRMIPGDFLIVNNKRMLHSRTQISDSERHLTRYWIEKPKANLK